MNVMNLGILGLGTVGQGLVELAKRNSTLIEQKSDVKINIKKVLVKDRTKKRSMDSSLLTFQPEEVIENKDINCVVELIGGVDTAFDFISRSLDNGKHVVTANKAVLAAHGGEILERAIKNKRQIGFEASVCGGIPIISALTSGLVANRIDLLCGIVNGTTNYVLTRMSEEGISMEDAIKAAQSAGFAEADPSLDIKGIDAAQKLIILSTLAFGVMIEQDRVSVDGIEAIETEDIRASSELGFCVKLLAMARNSEDKMDLRVEPAFLPKTHPLSNVRNEFNAVLIKGDAIGEMIFYGKGAGSLPTASAVMSDIIDIGRNPNVSNIKMVKQQHVPFDTESRFYLRFPIMDVPGVIGLITTALGNHGVSISHAVATLDKDKKGLGHVKIMTHKTRSSVIQRAVTEISRLPILTRKAVVFRILDEI